MTTATITVEQPDYEGGGPSGFADVVYVLTTPPPEQSWTLDTRICSGAALFAYALAHPMQFTQWANDTLGIATALGQAAYPEKRREWTCRAQYSLTVARLFLTAPRSPEERARQAFLQRCPTQEPRLPPEEGKVRVKWYPSVEATTRWPFHLGEIWVDLPLDLNGGVDLRPAICLWGMENCYTLDANRGKPHLSRHPVERLSALGVSVLLGDCHNVIGVTECSTAQMQAARKGRAYAKNVLRQMRPFILETLPRLFWETMQSLARIFKYTLANTPYVIWALLCALPYVLWYTVEISTLLLTGILLMLARGVWRIFKTYMLPPVEYAFDQLSRAYFVPLWQTCLPWVIAGMEATFLTDEEIQTLERQRMRNGD